MAHAFLCIFSFVFDYGAVILLVKFGIGTMRDGFDNMALAS
jgi:hypothetical protein